MTIGEQTARTPASTWTRNTLVVTNVSTIIAVAVSGYLFAQAIGEYVAQIDRNYRLASANSEAITEVAHTLTINRITSELKEIQRELRDKRLKLEEEPSIGLLRELRAQIAVLEDNEEYLSAVLECYRRNPNAQCEGG